MSLQLATDTYANWVMSTTAILVKVTTRALLDSVLRELHTMVHCDSLWHKS